VGVRTSPRPALGRQHDHDLPGTDPVLGGAKLGVEGTRVVLEGVEALLQTSVHLDALEDALGSLGHALLLVAQIAEAVGPEEQGPGQNDREDAEGANQPE
jgi:hypothetical protein